MDKVPLERIATGVAKQGHGPRRAATLGDVGRDVGRRSASASASPSRGPGNGILRAETGGPFCAQKAGERPEFGSQTATRLTNRSELRGFLSTRESRSVCQDCMVADAVPRNRSAEAE